MVAAMASITGPATGLAEIASLASEAIEGWLREYAGYRGLIVLTDESGERSRVITFWETAEDEARARQSRGAMRDSVAATVGMHVEQMDVFEVPVFEVAVVGD